MCVGHEANIATLQELAQELRLETEKIMGERARIKDVVSNKGEVTSIFLNSHNTITIPYHCNVNEEQNNV